MSSQKFNYQIPWPAGSDYMLRVIEESFGPSKTSGNPMITLKYEVVAPAEKDVAGDQIILAGVQITQYYSTKSLGDEEKTQKAVERVFKSANPERPALYELFGLEPGDQENPTLGFKGKVVYAEMGSESKARLEPLTGEEKAAGKKEGKPMKNPLTGKNLITYSPTIKQVFGLVPESDLVGVGSKAAY